MELIGYFDNAATTKPSEAVITRINEIMDSYGNPSSLHLMGMEAEAIIKGAKATISKQLGCLDNEVYFTSGGTESNNLALIGGYEAMKRRGNHIIASPFEHASVMETLKELQNRGAEIQWMSVDNEGIIDEETLYAAIRSDTIMVSLMHVNNEFGNVYPIERIAKEVKNRNPLTLFHSDGVQGFCKVPQVNLKDIDLYAFSSHKIHGLKGCGGLIVKKQLSLRPLFFGGGQQNGIRPGTENVVGIAALEAAIIDSKKIDTASILLMKNYVRDQLVERIPQIKINGSSKPNSQNPSSPFLLNLSITPLRGEVLVHALEVKGMIFSTGAACSSKAKLKTSILKSIGLSNDEISGTIRISFSRYNTLEQCERLVEELVSTIQMLSKFVRK